MSAFRINFKRECLLVLREPRLIVHALIFFLMLIIFFPLTLDSSSPDLLQKVLPGLIWTAILLACLLFSEHLFQREFEEGILEHWVLSKTPLSLVVSAKLLANWLLLMLSLTGLACILALIFNFALAEFLSLITTIFLGTPAIFLCCALAAAFSITTLQKGMLMSLILLPLTTPIMIFASAALRDSFEQLPITANLALIAAISLIAIGCLPFVIAAVLKVNVAE